MEWPWWNNSGFQQSAWTWEVLKKDLLNKQRTGYFVSQLLDGFLGISVLRTPLPFFSAAQLKFISISQLGSPGDDHIQQTCHVFRDISVAFGFLTLGNSPLASNDASSPATLPATVTQEWGSFSCLPASKGGGDIPVFPDFSFPCSFPPFAPSECCYCMGCHPLFCFSTTRNLFTQSS